jgi:DNA-binding transcriptional ArsR family regulator
MLKVEGDIHPLPDPARLFAALGDPTRIGLVARLSEGNAQSIAQMSQGLPISRQAVAKHLDVLLSAGLVRRTKSGREAHFTLDADALGTALRGEIAGLEGRLRQEMAAQTRVLVFAMIGGDVEPQHGDPLRLLVPGWYGMTSVKWLRRITAVTEPFAGYHVPPERLAS